jgi:hypothetical protein
MSVEGSVEFSSFLSILFVNDMPAFRLYTLGQVPPYIVTPCLGVHLALDLCSIVELVL